MKCTNCNNTLMLSIIPKRFVKFQAVFPVRPYRCIRCGKLQWQATRFYRNTFVKVITLLLVCFLFGVAGARFFSSDESMSVQRDIVQQPVPAAEENAVASSLQQTAPSASPPATTGTAAQATVPATVPTAGPEAPAVAAPATSRVTQQAAQRAAQRTKQQPAELQEISLSPKTAAQTPPLPEQQPLGAEAIPKAGLRTAKLLTRSQEGAVTVIIHANSPIAQYHSFMLKSPRRLVIDIPGKWTFSGKASTPVNKHIVRTIRTGVHKDKLRLVIDLTREPKKTPEIATAARGLMVVIP